MRLLGLRLLGLAAILASCRFTFCSFTRFAASRASRLACRRFTSFRFSRCQLHATFSASCASAVPVRAASLRRGLSRFACSNAASHRGALAPEPPFLPRNASARSAAARSAASAASITPGRGGVKSR
jgi:hypothetical protein